MLGSVLGRNTDATCTPGSKHGKTVLTTKAAPRATDLLEAVDVFLSTGARIGQVIALRWEDVDLDTEHPSLTISGTVPRYKG